MSEKRTFKTAGYSDRLEEQSLHFWPGPSSCGNIEDGIIFEHGNQGGWVVAFRDLELMYNLAKDQRERLR